MIRSELNFPCVEATRGFLTCKERNLRLSCSPKGEVFLSKHRRDWEEWYISIQEQHGLSIMRLQSVKHGYFLKAHTPGDDTGSTSPLVGTSELDSKDCRWLMEPSLLDTYPTCNDGNDDRPNQSKNNRFVLAGQFQQDVRLTTSTIRDTPTSKSSSPKKTPRSSVGRGFQFPFLVKQDPKAERQREEDDLQEEVSFEDEPPIPIPEDMRIRRSQSFDPSEDSSSSSIQGENEIDPEEGEGEDLSWEIEYSSGELCYISNPVIDRRIRCNVIGTLTLNEAWLGWELFRFIESNDEDGTLVISSWTHSDQFLSSDPDGNVFCTSNRLGYFEKWQVVRGDTAVRLQSVAHQRYLTVDGEGSKAKLRTTTSISEPRAQWHLEAAHRNTYSISSLKHGSSVSCAKEAPTVSKHPKAYGEWKIERAIDYDEGTFTLYNDKMKAYLGSTNAGKCTLTNKIGYWAIWEIEESPRAPGGILLSSHIHKRQLSCNEDGKLCTSDEYESEETWMLVPKLPFSLNGAQLAALGGAGAFSLMVTAAMPFAVMGLLGTAEVAVAEATVAAGLSAEALIGVGGGALLGAGVMRTTAALVTKENNISSEVKEDSVTHRCRPLSAWRTW